MDTSFKTRRYRQAQQLKALKETLYKTIYNKSHLLIVRNYNGFRLKSFRELWNDFKYVIKNKLDISRANYINSSISFSTRSLSSFDYHIQEKGGIVDNMGNVHTTAQSYKDYLKANDLVIKDWTDGSIKPKQHLADRAEVAKIVNKYI